MSQKIFFNKITLSFVMIVFVCFYIKVTVKATDVTSAAGFTYAINYPEKQSQLKNGYFDLIYMPGEKEEVTIELNNPNQEAITIEIALNGTKTNPNGVLEYGKSELVDDNSLVTPFEKVVTGPTSIELAAGENKKLTLDIEMPKEAFSGIILGGIQLKKAKQEKDELAAKGATVRNEYAYIIGMVLQNKLSEVKPEIKINEVKAAHRNYRNTILMNFSNLRARLVSNELSVSVEVNKKGSSEVIYERKQEGMSLAPNSLMDFYIPMNGEAMIAGDYEATILITIGDQKWQELFDFEITKNEAANFNHRDVGIIQERSLNWWLIVTIVLAILSIIAILMMFHKMSIKKRTKNKKRKIRKKRHEELQSKK